MNSDKRTLWIIIREGEGKLIAYVAERLQTVHSSIKLIVMHIYLVQYLICVA